jgi:hypothetical protein
LLALLAKMLPAQVFGIVEKGDQIAHFGRVGMSFVLLDK